jgi:hypothetical protein
MSILTEWGLDLTGMPFQKRRAILTALYKERFPADPLAWTLAEWHDEWDMTDEELAAWRADKTQEQIDAECAREAEAAVQILVDGVAEVRAALAKDSE